MQVGEVYENCEGYYQVDSITKGVVRFHYRDGRSSSGTLSNLVRAHRNLVIEHEKFEPEKYELLFIQKISDCTIRLQVNPASFGKFACEYEFITGEELLSDNPYVNIAPHYWLKVIALRIQYNRRVLAPAHLKPHRYNLQMEVNNTRLALKMFGMGFRIGENHGPS